MTSAFRIELDDEAKIIGINILDIFVIIGLPVWSIATTGPHSNFGEISGTSSILDRLGSCSCGFERLAQRRSRGREEQYDGEEELHFD